jgi:glycosyltransferase involved in cell wall biosynthesis
MDLQTNLSIVIPNHNEILAESAQYWCRRYFPKAEIIVENDEKGIGKGATLRKGLQRATRDWIVFLDGDLDIFPSEINKLIDGAKKADIVVGVKSLADLPFRRKIISMFSRMLIKGLFFLPVSDTQTGIKLFRREALSDWSTDGYAFDVELLQKAHKRGYKISEVMVNVNSTKSKNMRDIIKCLKDVIRLWFRS